MARLPYVDPATASPEAREALDALPDLHIFRMVGHADTAFRAWLTLGGTLLTQLALDPVLRELAILQIAATSGSDYERVQHEGVAAGVGTSAEAIRAVVEQRLDDPALADSVDVLRVVDELVRTHTTSEAGMRTLHDRLGNQQTMELLLVVGYYLGVALMAAAVDLDPDESADMVVVDIAERTHSQ